MTDHIPAAKLKDYLLHELRLTEDEHAHLSRCSFCMKAMVEAAASEISKQDSGRTPDDQD